MTMAATAAQAVPIRQVRDQAVRRPSAGGSPDPACPGPPAGPPGGSMNSGSPAVGPWYPGPRRSSASITGASGPADGARGASSRATPALIVIEPPGRSNGPRPSTAAYSVAPSDHRSDAGVALPPLTRSGAVNPGVPTIMPTW